MCCLAFCSPSYSNGSYYIFSTGFILHASSVPCFALSHHGPRAHHQPEVQLEIVFIATAIRSSWSVQVFTGPQSYQLILSTWTLWTWFYSWFPLFLSFAVGPRWFSPLQTVYYPWLSSVLRLPSFPLLKLDWQMASKVSVGAHGSMKGSTRRRTASWLLVACYAWSVVLTVKQTMNHLGVHSTYLSNCWS